MDVLSVAILVGLASGLVALLVRRARTPDPMTFEPFWKRWRRGPKSPYR